MRLPRRVPWKSIAELDQVCSWIFSDEHDLYSKNLAINRLSAWRAITPLPHALDSTLAILSVIVQDAKAEGASLFLLLRQSYASALIRLVNGLVDPLQLGVYARSIAGIAAQLDLPLWLVELRHAATHEDLPSLEVLREAAKQSMSWLFHNYWLPTLNPATPSQHETPLRPLSPILKQYKDLLKLTTRDASLKSRYKQSVQTIYKDIEKWIAEAKVAANVMSGELGWTTSGIADNAEGEQDPRERWALEILCDALLEKGGLVPLSKKRRTLPDDSPTSPPLGSVEIWSPLLIHIHSAHPGFFSNLATKIIYRLTADAQMSSKAPESPMVFDSSYATCLCRWLLWTVEFVESEDPDDGLRIDAFSMLITAIGPGSELSSQSKKVLEALMQDLCSGKADLDLALLALKPFDRSSSAAWSADDIVVMNERLDALLSVGGSLSEDETTSVTHDKPSIISALGWSLLDEASGWKPCPLGVYYDK